MALLPHIILHPRRSGGVSCYSNPKTANNTSHTCIKIPSSDLLHIVFCASSLQGRPKRNIFLVTPPTWLYLVAVYQESPFYPVIHPSSHALATYLSLFRVSSLYGLFVLGLQDSYEVDTPTSPLVLRSEASNLGCTGTARQKYLPGMVLGFIDFLLCPFTTQRYSTIPCLRIKTKLGRRQTSRR